MMYRLLDLSEQTISRRISMSELRTDNVYQATVLNERTGVIVVLDFPAAPTDQEVLDALPDAPKLSQARALMPTTMSTWEWVMSDAYGDWLRWKTTRLEAVARGAPAAVVTALTNKENAAWTAYLQSIAAWRQAT